MPDETNDDTVEFKAHVPTWFRSALSKYLPLVAVFFLGNGTAGAVLYRSPSAEEIASQVALSVARELEPIKTKLTEIEKRQTDLESIYTLYAQRISVMEKKLATRNR